MSPNEIYWNTAGVEILDTIYLDNGGTEVVVCNDLADSELWIPNDTIMATVIPAVQKANQVIDVTQ